MNAEEEFVALALEALTRSGGSYSETVTTLRAAVDSTGLGYVDGAGQCHTRDPGTRLLKSLEWKREDEEIATLQARLEMLLERKERRRH